MGREVVCEARVRRGTVLEEGGVKALLESTEVILRGSLKRRWAVTVLSDLAVLDDTLEFRAADEQVSLLLGPTEASKWLAKLSTPPPSLAHKLGVGPQSLACVLGCVDDAMLAQALAGVATQSPSQAAMLVAVMRDETDLQAAVVAHAGMPFPVLWAVYPKGRGSSLPDALVRSVLRAAGYVDNKTSAVSERLSATRYLRRN